MLKKLAGAVAVHPVAVAAGLAAFSLAIYPVTPTASVAVKVMATVKELAELAIDEAELGWLRGSPTAQSRCGVPP